MRNDDGEQLRLRLHQLAERSAKLDRPCAGRFIAAADRPTAVHEARESGVAVSFDGGWDEAERVQVCFHPEGDAPTFTNVWLEIGWASRFVHAEHRALLGSLMALGMDRAFLGDLIAEEDRAYLCALPEMAARLPDEWTKAGSINITVKLLDAPPSIDPPKGMLFKDTVASLRLDSVLASGLKISRARAADMVRQGLVMVEHQEETRIDRLLAAGALLSVRGYGRIRVVAVDPPTRKDRLPVTLELFGKA